MVIGIARKPNTSDLRDRHLTGLPDPGPDVTRRRAEFEFEQAALRAQVSRLEGEAPLSFLRTKIEVGRRSDGDGHGAAAGLDREMGLKSESEDRAGESDQGYDIGDTMGDEQIPNSTAQVDIPNEPDLPVANEVCEARKPRRSLRNRSPIQLHPYALEREVYRRTVKVERVE